MEHSILQKISTVIPQFRNDFDALVVVLHLAMREIGFRCAGLSESSVSNSNADFDQKLLPDCWNQTSDSYSFEYKHIQSSMTFVVKYLVMNTKLLVHGITKEDNKICSLELSVRDYVNGYSLSNHYAMYKDLDKLIALFKINITSKLLPGLNKAGCEAGTTDVDTTARPAPRRERVDPYEFPRAHNTEPLHITGTGIFPSVGVGYNDLHPPFTRIGVPGTQGNIMGPSHPLFGPRVNDPYAANPNFPYGSIGLPRGRVPGARFDPVGPPANPFNPPGSSNFGDELPPPGFDNIYL